MAAPNGTTEMITGRVEAVNERGVKVQGAWWNLSQYGPALPLPTRGASVTLTVKGKYIEAVDVLEAHTSAERPAPPSSARERRLRASPFSKRRPSSRRTSRT